MNNSQVTSNYFSKELKEFEEALESSGVRGALRYLNKRTPHRYTGIYKYDGDTLRSVAFYDKYDPQLQKGEDAPLGVTYCSLLQDQPNIEITDATEDSRVKGIIKTPVISYCGVVIKDKEENPIGTLCNFDMKRCQERSTDIPLLEAAAEILMKHLHIND